MRCERHWGDRSFRLVGQRRPLWRADSWLTRDLLTTTSGRRTFQTEGTVRRQRACGMCQSTEGDSRRAQRVASAKRDPKRSASDAAATPWSTHRRRSGHPEPEASENSIFWKTCLLSSRLQSLYPSRSSAGMTISCPRSSKKNKYILPKLISLTFWDTIWQILNVWDSFIFIVILFNLDFFNLFYEFKFPLILDQSPCCWWTLLSTSGVTGYICWLIIIS